MGMAMKVRESHMRASSTNEVMDLEFNALFCTLLRLCHLRREYIQALSVIIIVYIVVNSSCNSSRHEDVNHHSNHSTFHLFLSLSYTHSLTHLLSLSLETKRNDLSLEWLAIRFDPGFLQWCFCYRAKLGVRKCLFVRQTGVDIQQSSVM